MNNKIRIGILMFLAFFMISYSFAASVEVFSRYDTEVRVNANATIDVHKSIALQNIHTVGIVPGSVEFKINKKVNNSDSTMKLSNVKIVDRYNNPIKFKIVETKDYSIIALDIFSPLLPGFEYNMELDYTLEYESSGFFFKSIEVPVKEASTIPIKKGTFKLILPENYGFTYISYTNNSIVDKNSGTWELTEGMPSTIAFEYSYIPLNIGGMRGSLLFWIIIDAVLFIMLILELRKQIKKRREE